MKIDTALKSALLVATLHAAGFGMTWSPFPTCTESHQVDSIQSLVWIDESLIPELAPYLGHVRVRYHPGTCFTARTEQKPSYMDTLIVVEAGLTADRRRQDFRWLGPEPVEVQPHGTKWFSAAGEEDSAHYHSFGLSEGASPVRISHRVIHRRSAQSHVITSGFRRGDDPWEEYAKDSVVVSGGVTTVFTVDEDGSFVTRCVAEGSTFACTPTPIGEVTAEPNRQVWHLSGGRPDSLRTYRPDGRLESTDHWYWSPRVLVSVRRPFPRSSLRARAVTWDFNLLGRLLSKK